jgi:coenzyme F420-0:L-glutamate ligase/coenzyme F420-1:gamma-L-glutamate ligase
MISNNRIELFALSRIPLVEPDDDLATMIAESLSKDQESLFTGDILVIAQKIVSKSEGQYITLNDITPTNAARDLAMETEKDPRIVEIILRQSKTIRRRKPGIIIAEHHLGYVMANAGIDASNVSMEDGRERVLLLPESPDKSAAIIRRNLETIFDARIGVIINDSIGRAWRNGIVGTCLGSAGLPTLSDLRGDPDLFGRQLEVSTVGVADELSSAASLLQGQGNQGQPVVRIRGLDWQASQQTGGDLIREASQDLFQ